MLSDYFNFNFKVTRLEDVDVWSKVPVAYLNPPEEEEKLQIHTSLSNKPLPVNHFFSALEHVVALSWPVGGAKYTYQSHGQELIHWQIVLYESCPGN